MVTPDIHYISVKYLSNEVQKENEIYQGKAFMEKHVKLEKWLISIALFLVNSWPSKSCVLQG